MKRIKQHTVLVIGIILCLAAVLITMRTLFQPGLFRTHDFTHVDRLVEMQRSLQAGEFPVRWSRNFGFGYGMPLFNFYAPFVYYVGQIPLLFGSSAIDAVKFLYVLNGVLAFVGMYLFASSLWGKRGGLLSAVLFSFSTYRAVDLFVRGALSEAFAFVLLPFALFGVIQIVRQKQWGFPVTAISLALILISHNLTGLISVGLVMAFWFGFMLVEKKNLFSKSLLVLIISVVVGIGLSAFYVFPGFLEKGYTRVDQTIIGGYFDYHYNFLCSSQLLTGKWGYGGSLPGCNDDMSFALGEVTWIVFALSLLALLLFGKRKEKWIGALLLLCFAGSAFMTIGRSSIIWDRIELLKYFQFPWRFLSFVHVFISALAGASVLFVRWKKQMVIVIIGLLVTLAVVQGRLFQPEWIMTDPVELSTYFRTDPEFIRSQMSKILPDYIPTGIDDQHLPVPVDIRMTATASGTEILESSDTPARYEATVLCPMQWCDLRVNIFQFPGWSAYVDGISTPLDRSSGLPIYTLAVMKGSHQVRIQLENTAIARLSNLASILSLFVCTMYIVWIWRSHYFAMEEKVVAKL